MKSLVGAAIYLVAATGWALADAYTDFNAGLAAAVRLDADGAIKFLTSALSESDLPAHLRPVAYLARGREYADSRQYAAATADFTSAIQLKPDYVEAYLSRCDVKADQKNWPEAIADCTTAVNLQPNNWRLRDIRADIYLRAKRFDEAIAEFTAFVAGRPNAIEFRLERAYAFRIAGRFEEALTDAKASADADPRWAQPYTEMGMIYLAQRDLRHALDSFDSAIIRSRDDPLAYMRKGQVEWALGRYDDASDSFRDALKHDSLQRYAFLWLAMSQSRESASISPDIVKRFGDADLGGFTGQLVSLYLGRSVNVAELLKTRGIDPDSNETYECTGDFYIGEWYQANANSAEAKRLLQATEQTCSADGSTLWLAKVDLGRLP